MTNSQKAKGTAFESKVVEYLQDAGLTARRVVQAGALDQGDIHIGNVPQVVIEAKNQKRFDLSDWVRQVDREARNAHKPIGIVVAKRPRIADPAESYCLMSLSTLTQLLQLLRTDSTNEPREEA